MDSIAYREAFDAAQIAIKNLQKRGTAFRSGAARIAALAAIGAKDPATSIANALEGCVISINPNWDGSIA